MQGDNFLIVYADDFVAGFQYKWEAENYYKLLKERMEKFSLQLEDSKVVSYKAVLILQGAKQKSGECIRLQTFDFLGFTFYCGRSRKGMPYNAKDKLLRNSDRNSRSRYGYMRIETNR